MKIRMNATLNAEETKVTIRFSFFADDRAFASPEEQFAVFSKKYAKAFSIGFIRSKYELIADVEANEAAVKPFIDYASEIETTIIF